MKSFITFFRSSFLFFIIVIGLKVIFLRYLLFEEYNILNTIWYELSFIIILLAIIELVFKTKKKIWAYIVLDLILSGVFFSMAVYERYFGTIPTYYDLSQLSQVGSVSSSVLLLISVKDIFFLFDFILLGILLSMRKLFHYPINLHFPKKFLYTALVISLAVASTNFLLHRDERILDQALFAKKNGIVNSQFIKAYGENNRLSNFNESNLTVDDMIKMKGNNPVPFEEHKNYNVAAGRNLIVLQIESLQDFVINLKIAGQEITPNLNKWVQESFYFTDVFQQIGAGNTSDAEFMMNTSIYPIGETPTSNQIEGKDLTSLPKLLRGNGYYTATFHADDIEYWNRNILYPALGFDTYYALDYYGEKDVVGFGPSDEYFYDKTMEKLIEFDNENKPFYAHVISLTNHSPFEMPEDKKMLDLPEKYKGTLIGNYLQAVRYADYALGQFFDDLRESGLWNQSIIVLYGDHSGVHGQLVKDKDVTLLRELLGQPYSLVNRFNVPFIVGIPGVTEEIGKKINTVGGQLDMMPTVLNLMGIKPEGLYFGQDLLEYDHNLLGMRYYLSTGAFINDDVLFIPETSKREMRIYDLKNKDRFTDISNPMQYFQEEYENILQLYDWSDAYFQQGQ